MDAASPGAVGVLYRGCIRDIHRQAGASSDMGRPSRDAARNAEERQPKIETRTPAANSLPPVGPSNAGAASSPILVDTPICESGIARK